MKHAIYGKYVERWARILLSRWDFVRIVDACAGAGADADGRPGSPLIAFNEGQKAAAQLSSRTGERKVVDFVFIERSRGRLASLKKQVGERSGVRYVQGTLTDVVGSLEADGKKIPHLYFIDPFGVAPLQADTIRRALTGGHNEVFLLFAGPAIRRHFGSYLSVQQQEVEVDLFSGFDVDIRADDDGREEARLRGAAASAEILDTAFGDHDWRDILELPRRQRLDAAVRRYCDLLLALGANRVLPMPILDGTGNLKYHLIYATKSPRGYEVMKDAMERGFSEGLVGKEEHMRLGATIPTSEVERLVRQHFAGREVPWSAEGNGETVRGYALEDTPASVRQVAELKERIQDLKVPGRGAHRYNFPPLSANRD
ncbi:MAG TPA: three-Cys-motif partner protein TcmP [Longimicrobium sp.]|nr:three-Cys-motif partner protein TcmP [Longimicrobium sp.]